MRAEYAFLGGRPALAEPYELKDLTTPLLADACVRLGFPVLTAPPGISPLARGSKATGRVLPARHAGSVDVFLEALDDCQPGDILVIDNDGRLDEGCIGDLVVIEAAAAGAAGVVVWGAHRDSAELLLLSIPVWSYGHCPNGPLTLRPQHEAALKSARMGTEVVDSQHIAFDDDDGVIFLSGTELAAVADKAREIAATERQQAEAVSAGTTLRQQLRFAEYLERRARDPDFSFRQHLRKIGGAIEA
ncbi:MAG TPA: RraA family protein [Acidobacteriota bacterium]|nr:RraA family protein [Acidobacteriota bacterium]